MEMWKAVQYMADEKYVEYIIETLKVTRATARKHLNNLYKAEKATGLHGTVLIKDMEKTKELLEEKCDKKSVKPYMNSLEIYKKYKEK